MEPSTIILSSFCGLLATVTGYLLYRRKYKAETKTAESGAEQSQINTGLAQARSQTELLATIQNLVTESATKSQALATSDIMVQVEARDNERLRGELRKFWMAEGGCLERERMLTDQIREKDRQYKDALAELKLDHQNQIDDIKLQLREALGYKEKNVELAEENSRLLAMKKNGSD